MPADLPSTALPELEPSVPPPTRAEFPTEDDTPVDNLYSEKQQRLLTEPLYSSWSGPDGGGKFVAMANVGLFYSDTEPPIVPDGLLSVGVQAPDDMWPRENRSYFVRRYGKSPEVVIEVVSNLEGKELDEKPRIYAQAKVLYYVVWDPEKQLKQGRWTAFRLKGQAYEPHQQLWFEEIGLGLTLWHGWFEGKKEDWLRWCDKSGAVIPTGAEAKEIERARAQEEKRRAEAQDERAEQETQRAEKERHFAERERQRAEQERQRAEQERQRAEQEKQRADRLAAQLKSMGIDPDSLP
jgi:Uma2 family endonuclease